MRVFGIPECTDKALAMATALSYWVFVCRDTKKSPAMGVKTWEYLQSSTKNAAIVSKSVEDYLEQLSKKLVVSHLHPKKWERIINPEIVIQRVKKDGELIELNLDQNNPYLKFVSWRSLINDLAPQGINDKKILEKCLKQPHLITTFARIKYEEDKALNSITPDENIYDVEAL